MKKINQKRLYRKILEQIESSMNLRGNKGYGVGHPHQSGTKRVYGKSEIEYQADNDAVDDRHNAPDDVDPDLAPVEVSRVFEGDDDEQ